MKTKISKKYRLTALLLTLCLLYSFTGNINIAEALEAENIDSKQTVIYDAESEVGSIPPDETSLLTSYHSTIADQTMMDIRFKFNHANGAPSIHMIEYILHSDGSINTTEQPFNYGYANRFASVTGVAEKSGNDWLVPELVLGSADAPNNTGSIKNAENVSSDSAGTLFAPKSISRIYTEDLIDNTSGASKPDGKPDVLGIVGLAPGQPDIQVTVRYKLMKNSITNAVDMLRMTVEAANKSTTKAYVYALSWNVDTYVGNLGDHAKYQAPGVKQFSVEDVQFKFPNPGTAPWENYLTADYTTQVPTYLYAENPNAGNDFTAIFYPTLFGERDSSYPGITFETADYLGVGHFSNIITDIIAGNAEAYYYWDTATGAGGDSKDAGHIVRYNPRLLLPESSLYFGVDYGQGKVGESGESDPYIQVSNITSHLPANDSGTGYDALIEPDVTYGNLSATSFGQARVEIEMDKRYLKPDYSMISGGWTRIGTDGNIETWALEISGGLEAFLNRESLTSKIGLQGIPVNDNVFTDITFRLVTAPTHEGDTTYMSDTRTIELEECIYTNPEVRLTGVTDTAKPNVTKPAVHIDADVSKVELTKDVWGNRTVQLDFNPTRTSSVRTDYTWTLVSDPSHVITGFDTGEGTLTFTGNTGTALVRIALTANPEVSHDMDITMTSRPISQHDDCTVTFNTNGGSNVDVQHITSGDKVTEPAAPTKNGYLFAGWYTDSAFTKKYDFTTAVTSSFTLYARWTKAHEPYIAGYGDGTFRPNHPVTRAEAAQLLYNISGATEAGVSKFSDVLSEAWYHKAVTYLNAKGIISGYPDGSFKPHAGISRAEFVTLVSKYNALSPAVGNDFSDVKADHWANGYIAAAYKAKWITGYEDGTFRPDSAITRAEAVSVLNAVLGRAMDKNTAAGLKMPFTDVPAAFWAYGQILEAAVRY